MEVNKIGKVRKEMQLVKDFAILPNFIVNFSSVVLNPYKDSTIPEELEILIKDYQELEELEQDTTSIEQQISARLLLLKEELKYFVEHSLDIPVTLDGELLTYDASSREKKYIDKSLDSLDPEWVEKMGVKDDDGYSFYFYKKYTIYQLDVIEESLMAVIRFINSKKTPSLETILSVLKSYRQAKKVSYGYRVSYLTSVDEKDDIEKNKETTVYTGTIFNNTQYSLRTSDLITKILLKVKTDYVTRIHSTYPAMEYIIKRVDGRWLIIHKGTGATDILTDEEGNLCAAVSQVQSCLDEKGILANSRKTDLQIEILQNVLESYLKREYKYK